MGRILAVGLDGVFCKNRTPAERRRRDEDHEPQVWPGSTGDGEAVHQSCGCPPYAASASGHCLISDHLRATLRKAAMMF